MGEILGTQKPFYTFIWCSNDEADFRNKTPLELVGESLKKFRGLLGVRLVVLEGYEKFSPEYLTRLRESGYDTLDYSAIFKTIVARFPNLNAHYSHYERNCFLRWIAFAEIVERENVTGQLWHLDSDLVFYTSLDEIALDTAKKTFVLQGCPAFVSITDRRWFEVYRQELGKLEQDIIGYSAAAALKKLGSERLDEKLGNKTAYRNPLGSDQDFLEYLVGSGKIPQTEGAGISTSRFCFFENPLSIRKLLPNGNGKKFTDSPEGMIYYGGKNIPFIHYQGTFCFFGNIYLCLVQWRLHHLRCWKRLVRFKTVETKFRISFAAKVIWKIAKWRDRRFSKEKVILLLTTRSSQSPLPITDLLNFINETEDKLEK